MGMSEVSDNK